MITLHDKKETDFQKNGYGVLDDLIFNQGGSWEMNGEYKISFEIPALTEYTDQLKARNIIQAPVPFSGRQLFRIYRTEQTLTSIYIEARHIFYDLLDNWVEEINIVKQYGNNALQLLLNKTQYPHKFTATSNIQTSSSARIIQMNPVEALLDDKKEYSFINRWGGELVRNNFQIELLERMGANRGVEIEHRKDLLGYEAIMDATKVVTRIHPVGFDGLMLPERYVDSPLIDPDHPIIAEVKYENIKAATDESTSDEEAVPLEEAYELLRQAARNEFEINHVDEPETVVNVNFIALHNTEQYKDFAALQEVKAGDTVKIIAPDHRFEITSRLIAFEFSLVKENSYTSTTLGNHVFDYTSSGPSVENLESKIDDVQQSVVTAILAANGRNRNFYGSEEPNTLELDARLGDNYFLENGESYITYLLVEVNGERYWKRASLDEVALNTELVEQQQEIETMKVDVDYSRDQIQQTIDNSGFTDLDTALANIQTLSEQAIIDSDKAIQSALDSAELIGEETDRANSIRIDIDEIAGVLELDASETVIDRLTGDITQLDTRILNQAGFISQKVSQVEVDAAIKAIQIGGRNLLLDSKNITFVERNGSSNEIVDIFSYTNVIKITNPSNATYTNPYETYSEILKAGETYTLSFMFTYTGTKGTYDRIYLSSYAGSYTTFTGYPEENKLKKMHITFVPTNDIPSPRLHLGIVGYDVIYLTEFKLEKGNKPTDWTPAPEDVMKDIKVVETQFIQTFDTFKTSVTGANGRLTLAEQFLDGFKNTAFDPESGQLSLTEQTIEGLQDTVFDPVNGLETKVTTISDGFQVLSSRTDKINSWTNTYRVNTATPLPLTDLNDAPLDTKMTYDVTLGIQSTSSVTHFACTLLSYYDHWELKINQEPQSQSSNRPYIYLNDEGYPMVTLYGHNTLYTVLANITASSSRNYSSFSLMNDNINLKVQKGEVVSQINLEAGKTLIQTDKLYLDAGTTVFGGDAFIPGAYIKDASIDTAKIADLSVSSAKIIGLDVNKVSGNTSEFVKSNWNAINSQLNIDGNKLEYSHSDGSKTILSASGLYHSEGGSNYTTNYLFDVITVTGLNHSSSVKWVNLPSIYKGKNFKAHAVVSDTYGVTNDYAYFNLAMLRVVCFVDTIDKNNGRVGLRGYSYHRDIRNNKTFRRAIQCKLIVTY